MQKNISRLFNQLSRLNILVIGDVMLDIADFCETAHSRILISESDAQDVRAYMSVNTLKNIGGAGNVAANLKTLGANAKIIGITGKDGAYQELKDLSCSAGIEHHFLVDETRPSTVKRRLYIDNNYKLRFDNESTKKITEDISKKVYRAAASSISSFDALILSDYNKGIFTENLSQNLIALAKKHGIPIIVDCKPANIHCFIGADIVAPNDLEAAQIIPEFKTNALLEKNVCEIRKKLGAKWAIVTLGKDGICGHDGNSFHHQPANPVKAVGTCGAGDTVRAAMALGLACNFNLPSTLKFANDVASIVVRKIGVATVSLDEIKQFYANASLDIPTAKGFSARRRGTSRRNAYEIREDGE